jgi:hypothetical protein
MLTLSHLMRTEGRNMLTLSLLMRIEGRRTCSD